MKQNKIYHVKVRMKEEAYKKVKRKFELAHCRNRSAYLRRMALYGFGMVFPDEQLKIIQTTVGKAVKNLYQIVMPDVCCSSIVSEGRGRFKKGNCGSESAAIYFGMAACYPSILKVQKEKLRQPCK